ncbi:hypothetical protein ACIRST_09140 [Kitasatospora sp. NPDC101447]|uniref:hypothetical protein n=1 Tax=Kitasatospora sp. NPDC101447 TaxID=3364102 RepID=UPI00382242EB
MRGTLSIGTGSAELATRTAACRADGPTAPGGAAVAWGRRVGPARGAGPVRQWIGGALLAAVQVHGVVGHATARPGDAHGGGLT